MDFISNKQIINIAPSDKNIDIKLILLNMINRNRIKQQDLTITTFLAADETASIHVNIYGDTGLILRDGDIIFMKGAYASIFKTNLILYASKPENGKIIKLGEFFMLFKELPNISQYNWKRERDEKTGLETFQLDNSN